MPGSCGSGSRHTTSSTASPLSGHRMWSDICDSDDDTLSEWSEERMLPETLLSSIKEADLLLRKMPQEIEDSFESEASSTILSAHAPEFLPTLTMQCPVVGICHVIMEGDELSLSMQDCDAHPAARTKPFWRNKRPSLLEEARPQVPQGISQGLTEEQIERRIRNIEIGKETKEYAYLLEQRKLGQSGDDEPLTPDPRDTTISKRSWLREVQCWRQDLRQRYLLENAGIGPDVASVVSTEAEEAQGSEADDTLTVNSDDASSAHWSSR